MRSGVKNRVLFILTLSVLSWSFQSCSWGVKDIWGRYRYQCEGTYKSSVSMSNNDTFSITLNEDRSFHEHNYWGDMYGRWGISQSGDFIKKICLMLWTDSICSYYYFHNDDGIPIETAVYYYGGERNERNVVRVRDRDGDSLSILNAYFYNQKGENISVFQTEKVGTYTVEIPSNTSKLTVFTPYMMYSHCVCKNYCKDSGDVIFVLVPNVEGLVRTRIRYRNTISIKLCDGKLKRISSMVHDKREIPTQMPKSSAEETSLPIQ